MSGVLEVGQSLFKKLTVGKAAQEKARRTKTSPADVIQFSGCKDNQTSADAVEKGEATGAMSWAFREVLNKTPHISYHQLLVSVRDLLAGKYQQKPVLSCSHPLDTNLLFVI
jgi:metacaspase-1